MKLYLLSDICLLADVFQMFRTNSLDEYQLGPAYFVSAPQLAWNALLKHINRSIPLITDSELYPMIQPNICGSNFHASVRYSRANNKLMGSLYDTKKPTSYIMEVDVNNLYNWAMSRKMPDCKFEWVSADECCTMKQQLNFADGRIAIFDQGLFDHRVLDEKKCFIFVVDLEHPPEPHERDDDYPLAPDVITIETKVTGEKQHNLRAQYFGAACPFSRIMICSFLPKKHYVVLGQLRRFYLDRGIKPVKVHRAIRFNSTPYVEGYIANNTEKRKQFKHDDVKKAFYKLMNNAPYGKTIENVARCTDIRPLNDMEKARKLAEKPHCVDFCVFDGQVAPTEEAAVAEEQRQQEALVGIEMRKLNHFINKPFANGFCVLEYSKLKMYETCLPLS